MNGRALDKNTVESIISYRRKGYSLPEISNILSIPKTTVFRYVKDVKMDPEYISEWLGKRGGSKKLKLSKEKTALEEVQKLIDTISHKEKLLFISALYWAEGSKRDFGLSNTDPLLIKTFVMGLREVFNITNEQLRVSVRIYEDLDPEKCLGFWSGVVDIPKENFVSVNVIAGKKKGKLEYGMCRIRVTKGEYFLKRIFAVNKVFSTKLSP